MPCYQIDGLVPVVDPGADGGANVQDHCTLHGVPGADTLVETDGHIGHGAVLHGCVVQRGALVGMNAVVMDEAEIGEHAIVATSAFIRAGMKVPPRTLVPACRARWCANSAKRRWHEARRHLGSSGAGRSLPCVAARGGAAGDRMIIAGKKVTRVAEAFAP